MCDKQCPVKTMKDNYKERLIAEQQEHIQELNQKVKDLEQIIVDYQELIDKMMEDAEEAIEQ